MSLRLVNLTSNIAEELSLTEIEAAELERKALALAQNFRSLRSTYSVDHVIATETHAKKAKQNRFKTGWRSVVSKATNWQSAKARRMWQAFEKCRTAHEEFKAVCSTHSISGGMEPILTQVLELAHQHNRLTLAEQVVEGRRIYENLSREAHRISWQHA